MHYRRDVDGLRALAILPVVAFHFGVTTGGFVGVDIFFVISGYLITGLIVHESDGGRFSLSGFYQRRVRRILPALCAMLLFFLALGLFTLTAPDRANLAKTSLFALFSVSNLHFAQASGYFARGAWSEPLLNTWSLGVEEQFYLFFPMMIVGLNAIRAPRRIVFLGLLVLSLAISTYGAFHSARWAFYELPSRAWELLLGALLAVRAIPAMTDRRLREGVGLAGLALIGGSVLLISEKMPFPGLTALAPCLGAAALIHAGASGPTLAGRLLETRPLVGVGLISYSLYLWHWPLLYFQRTAWVFFPFDSRIGSGIVLLTLCFLAAYLSWRFVENPARRRDVRFRTVLGGVLAAVAVICAASATLVATGGLPRVFPGLGGPYAAYLDTETQAARLRSECFLWKDFARQIGQASSAAAGSDGDERLHARCVTPVPGRKNILVIGDSHAARLPAGLKVAYPEYNVLEATAARCKPVPRQTEASYPTCQALMRRIYEEVLPGGGFDAVLLSGNWSQGDIDALTEATRRLSGTDTRVVWLGPLPHYDRPLPQLLTMAWRFKDPAIPERHRLRETRRIDRAMAERARSLGVTYVSLLDTLCPGGVCVTADASGAPLQYDEAHLTPAGSREVAERLRRVGFLLP